MISFYPIPVTYHFKLTILAKKFLKFNRNDEKMSFRPSEEKQRIDKLLATPKDRVQRAQAAQAMYRLSFEKTPPQEANRMPPRTPASILKSGGRRGGMSIHLNFLYANWEQSSSLLQIAKTQNIGKKHLPIAKLIHHLFGSFIRSLE